MLPGIDGFEVRSVRRPSDVPIMVTAPPTIPDVVAGLGPERTTTSGTKPFVPKELSAYPPCCAGARLTVPGNPRLRFGTRGRPQEGVVTRADQPVHPTKMTEFRLLVELANPPRQRCSRGRTCWRGHGGVFGDGRLVDVHVRRLRTKIEAVTRPTPPRRHRARLGYKLQP